LHRRGKFIMPVDFAPNKHELFAVLLVLLSLLVFYKFKIVEGWPNVHCAHKLVHVHILLC
jgi:hypothetical protein